MARKRTVQIPSERLVAEIRGWSTSYYLSQHTHDHPVDDEAITNLQCKIVDTDERHAQHRGATIDISLVCSRRYSDENTEVRCDPMLFSMTLRKNNRSLLCYLPDYAYWALPTLLDQPADPCLEVVFERLHRGSGEVRGLWIGSYAELQKQEEALAECLRAK